MHFFAIHFFLLHYGMLHTHIFSLNMNTTENIGIFRASIKLFRLFQFFCSLLKYELNYVVKAVTQFMSVENSLQFS